MILHLLSDTPRNKRTLAALAFGCHCPGDTCTHKRDVEESVRALILEGHWIVSDGRGYRLTDDPADMERYIASLEGRRDSLTERVRALKTALEARRLGDVTQEALPWVA